MHRGSASRIVLRDESLIVEQQKQQQSSSSTAVAAQQQWWRRCRVAVFGPSTPGRTRTPNKKMEHRSGTLFRDSLHIMHCGSVLRIVLRDASRIVEQQKQQHSSSGGSDVAATDEKDERGYTGEPFVFVLALSRNLKRTSADTPRSLLLTTAVLLCR